MRKDYDVIICGGGTSGIAAAIASARTGAKTLLIERNGSIGGQMNVSGPPGFSYAHLFNPRGEQVIAGIIEETHARLVQEGHGTPHNHHPYREGTGYTFSYIDPEWWCLLMFQMMTENDVDLLLHTLVVGVTKKENAVNGVIVENTNGRIELRAKVVIDCTGEGDIAVRAGCDYEMVSREDSEPHSVCFTLDGIHWDEWLEYVHAHPEEISDFATEHPNQINLNAAESHSGDDHMNLVRSITNPLDYGEVMGFSALRDKAIANGDWHEYAGVGFFFTPKNDGSKHIQAHCQHSAQVPNLLSTDAWDLSRAEIECRRQIAIAANFFRKYMPGFQDSYIAKMGVELRLREGRRIVGDYRITREDVISGARFYDCIGKSAFAAGDIHVANANTLGSGPNGSEKPKDGGTHDIPYRCMVPQKVENLLVAGKHVSTDRDAYMRFLQETMVTGQAAGTAAALCVKNNVSPRGLEAPEYIGQLQSELRRQGVILDGVH